MLKLYFGLEAVLYHEHLGYAFTNSVPAAFDITGDAYYTISFLVPVSMAPKRPVQEIEESVYYHQQFIDPNSQAAFRQVIDPQSLVLTDSVKMDFARAMRVLNLQPHYHLSQLEPLFIPVVQDKALMTICKCERSTCPCDKDLDSFDKLQNLEEFLEAKNQGSWTA